MLNAERVDNKNINSGNRRRSPQDDGARRVRALNLPDVTQTHPKTATKLANRPSDVNRVFASQQIFTNKTHQTAPFLFVFCRCSCTSLCTSEQRRAFLPLPLFGRAFA
jgi:hypothetical protein